MIMAVMELYLLEENQQYTRISQKQLHLRKQLDIKKSRFSLMEETLKKWSIVSNSSTHEWQNSVLLFMASTQVLMISSWWHLVHGNKWSNESEISNNSVNLLLSIPLSRLITTGKSPNWLSSSANLEFSNFSLLSSIFSEVLQKIKKLLYREKRISCHTSKNDSISEKNMVLSVWQRLYHFVWWSDTNGL